MHKRSIDTNVIFPLIASVPLPAGAHFNSWKKLDGLGQVLTKFDNASKYEFILLIDTEIAINDCNAFGGLLTQLREKQQRKVWYGDHLANDIDFRIKDAARALTLQQNLTVDRKIALKTQDYTIFTWWTDIPFVEFWTAHRMFQHFSQELTGAELLQLPLSQAYSEVAQRLANLQERSTPVTDVSKNLGDGKLDKAGYCFEHLMFQLYTVVYEGWQIQDLTNSYKYPHNHIHQGQSLLEKFYYMPDSDKQVVLNTVKPMWLPCACDVSYLKPVAPIPLRFHLDRTEYCPCCGCRAPEPEEWRILEAYPICSDDEWILNRHFNCEDREK